MKNKEKKLKALQILKIINSFEKDEVKKEKLRKQIEILDLIFGLKKNNNV